METLGERLRHARLRRSLSQTELAERSGVSPITIARIESGVRKEPHPRTIRKLAAALGVDPAWLLFGEDTGGSTHVGAS